MAKASCALGGFVHVTIRAASENANVADVDSMSRALPEPRTGHKSSFLLGLTITALNPMLIAAWTAAVTALYSLDLLRFDRGAALSFSIGACSGITAWFATLLGFLRRFRSRLSRGALDRVMRGMGVMLILVGLGLAARFAYRL